MSVVGLIIFKRAIQIAIYAGSRATRSTKILPAPLFSSSAVFPFERKPGGTILARTVEYLRMPLGYGLNSECSQRSP